MTDQSTVVSPQEATGNPFNTPEINNQRWDQRRTVRCIPAHVYGLVREVEIPAFDDPFKRQLVELHVRERAEQEATDALREYLEQCELAERTQGFTDVLKSVGLTNPFIEFAEDVAAEAREARLAQPSTELLPALARYLFLICLADDLADDGYRDPRRGQPVVTTQYERPRSR